MRAAFILDIWTQGGASVIHLTISWFISINLKIATALVEHVLVTLSMIVRHVILQLLSNQVEDALVINE